MEKFAIVKIQGKQYLARKGEHIVVDRLPDAKGKTIKLAEVLLKSDGKKTEVGTPRVKGASIGAKVIAHTRGPKGLAFRYHSKKRVRKTKGFRAEQTEIEVTTV